MLKRSISSSTLESFDLAFGSPRRLSLPASNSSKVFDGEFVKTRPASICLGSSGLKRSVSVSSLSSFGDSQSEWSFTSDRLFVEPIKKTPGEHASAVTGIDKSLPPPFYERLLDGTRRNSITSQAAHALRASAGPLFHLHHLGRSHSRSTKHDFHGHDAIVHIVHAYMKHAYGCADEPSLSMQGKQPLLAQFIADVIHEMREDDDPAYFRVAHALVVLERFKKTIPATVDKRLLSGHKLFVCALLVVHELYEDDRPDFPDPVDSLLPPCTSSKFEEANAELDHIRNQSAQDKMITDEEWEDATFVSEDDIPGYRFGMGKALEEEEGVWTAALWGERILQDVGWPFPLWYETKSAAPRREGSRRSSLAHFQFPLHFTLSSRFHSPSSSPSRAESPMEVSSPLDAPPPHYSSGGLVPGR